MSPLPTLHYAQTVGRYAIKSLTEAAVRLAGKGKPITGLWSDKMAWKKKSALSSPEWYAPI